MSLVGLGVCPLGVSLIGLGLVSEELGTARPKVFAQADGTQGNAPLMVGGDYVLDSRARAVGADSIEMRVQLALLTARDSSAVKGFGLDLKLDLFRPDSAQRADSAVRAALADLVVAQLISIQSVTFSKDKLLGIVRVKWIDLKSAQLKESSVNV